MALKVNCPSCGGSVEFKSSISLLAICPYCRSALIRKDLNIENLGKVADLHKDDSLLQLGTSGQYDRIAFSIVGRTQMKYDAGYWNEWYLSFQDGKFGWLAEAMGEYMVSFQSNPKENLPASEGLAPGTLVALNGKAYEVSGIEDAKYVSAEGELPSEIPLGELATFVDLAAEDGSFATLDYSETPCLAYIGKYVDFDQLKFQNLRRQEA